MKTFKLVVVLFGLSFAFTAQAATVSGVIRFSGMVYSPASASMTFNTLAPSGSTRSRQIYSLPNAQRKLSSQVLDYFATYAPKDAKFISVTYN